MKIDKKNFKPILAFTKKGLQITAAPFIEDYFKEGFTPELKKMINTHITSAHQSGNIFTASKKMDDKLKDYCEYAVKKYLNDPERPLIMGAYLDGTMPVASMELFSFFPVMEMNERTGKEELVIKYVFANIQEDKLCAHGAISFTYNDDMINANVSMIPQMETEQNNCVRYMTYLFKLSCVMKYCDKDVIDIVTVYGNQYKNLPDGSGAIHNRSGIKIKCVCPK